MSSGAIRQMRYCTGNVTIGDGAKYCEIYSGSPTTAPTYTKTVEETFLMPVLDSNKMIIIKDRDLSWTDGPFNGGYSGSAYFASTSSAPERITNGFKLTFKSNAHKVQHSYGQPEKWYNDIKTLTYRFFIIEFY